MKKLFALMMALVLCFCFVACSGGSDTTDNDDKKSDETTADSATESDTEAPASDTELPEYYNEIVEYIELGKELTDTDLPIETCVGCEEDNDMADKDIILCSSCIAAETCFVCENTLDDGIIFICEECLDESYAELNEYIASLEDDSTEDDTASDAVTEDTDYSDEFAEYYLSLEEFVSTNMPDDVVEGECVNCGAETGSFIFCDDCIKTEECVFCGTEIEKYEAVICTDCFDALKSEY